MKKYILLIILTILTGIISAQVTINFNKQPSPSVSGIFSKNNILKEFKYQYNHIEFSKNKPFNSFNQNTGSIGADISLNFKFGVEKFSNYFVQKVKLTVVGVSAIKISFDQFKLSENAEMYIYNVDKTIVTGPISKKENVFDSRTWNSNSFPDSSVIIEIKSPISEIRDNKIHIYKIFVSSILTSPTPINKTDSLLFGRFNTSSSCNINVLCPQGSAYSNERKAICEIESQDMSGYASGELIMNTCSTNIPYLLTAKHVTDGIDYTKANYIFGWWSATCTPNTYNQQAYLFNGASLVSSNMNTDFSLLKLSQTPPSNYDITYLGWSRTSTPPASSVCISHPMGDQMKISFANNPASIGTIYTFPNTAWRVLWSTGIVESGSSGSPLLGPDKRVVGQLYSNTQPTGQPCNQQTGGTNFGRFDLSWTGGGTNSTRLSNWLDPTGTGAMTTNTTNINQLISAQTLSISGNTNLCSSSSSYTLNSNGVPYTGNVNWTSSNSSIASITPNGNPATLTKVGSGTVTITASVCGINISKTVYVGSPSLNNFSFTTSGPSCVTGGGAPLSVGVTYSGYSGCDLNYQAGVTSVDWQIYASNSNYPYTVTYNAGIYTCSSPSQVNNAGLSVAFSYPAQPYVITFRYRINNGCGSSQWSPGNSVLVQACGGFNFIVSPNPTDGTLSIAFDENTLKNNINSNIRKIDIMDKFGKTVKRFSYGDGTKNITINISDLKTDVYFIKVFNGKEWKGQEIIKK